MNQTRRSRGFWPVLGVPGQQSSSSGTSASDPPRTPLDLALARADDGKGKGKGKGSGFKGKGKGKGKSKGKRPKGKGKGKGKSKDKGSSSFSRPPFASTMYADGSYGTPWGNWMISAAPGTLEQTQSLARWVTHVEQVFLSSVGPGPKAADVLMAVCDSMPPGSAIVDCGAALGCVGRESLQRFARHWQERAAAIGDTRQR